VIYDPLRIMGSPSKTSPGTCPLHNWCQSLLRKHSDGYD
jgi:hypothetical protein